MLKENLKAIRERQKLSKSELARRCGIPARTIEFIENGKTVYPRLDTLTILAKELNVEISELIK